MVPSTIDLSYGSFWLLTKTRQCSHTTYVPVSLHSMLYTYCTIFDHELIQKQNLASKNGIDYTDDHSCQACAGMRQGVVVKKS